MSIWPGDASDDEEGWRDEQGWVATFFFPRTLRGPDGCGDGTVVTCAELDPVPGLGAGVRTAPLRTAAESWCPGDTVASTSEEEHL